MIMSPICLLLICLVLCVANMSRSQASSSGSVAVSLAAATSSDGGGGPHLYANETHPNCTNCHFSPFSVFTPSNANSLGAYFVPTQTHPIYATKSFQTLYYANWGFFQNISYSILFFYLEPLNLSGIHGEEGKKWGTPP